MADTKPQFRCEECGAIFDNEVEWEQHNRAIHTRYTCQTCRELFLAEDELEAHNLEKHPHAQKDQR